MFKNLPENVRLILSSTLPLLVVIILFLVVGKFGFSRIGQVREQTALVEKDNTVLNQKLSLITAVSDVIGEDSVKAASAMPGANPSLVVISQLRTLAVQNTVLLSRIKAAGEVKDNSGLSRIDIAFEATGGRPQIIAFLKGVSGFAPITLVEKVKVNESAGTVRADIAVKAFWSEFPVKLPALTEPITDLTADERQILGEIGNLIQPSFLEITPSEGGGKSNPFGP